MEGKREKNEKRAKLFKNVSEDNWQTDKNKLKKNSNLKTDGWQSCDPEKKRQFQIYFRFQFSFFTDGELL